MDKTVQIQNVTARLGETHDPRWIRINEFMSIDPADLVNFKINRKGLSAAPTGKVKRAYNKHPKVVEDVVPERGTGAETGKADMHSKGRVLRNFIANKLVADSSGVVTKKELLEEYELYLASRGESHQRASWESLSRVIKKTHAVKLIANKPIRIKGISLR